MKKLTKEEFIERSRKIHNDKYDYSKVEYVNNSTKVCIICPMHGEFWQLPREHLNKKQGCPKCVGKNKTTEEFIEKARKEHGSKYDYSKIEYVNNRTKICIICPIHGEFWQTPEKHLYGNGCSKCSGKMKKNTVQFIEQAKQIHGSKYEYSKVEYVNNSTKVCIICKIHGEFWQTPKSHLHLKCGCPRCNSSHLENEIRLLLTRNKIEFEEQKRFEWLGRQSLDFYLSKYNIAIECQGLQHFNGWNKNEKTLKEIKKRDERKHQLCEEHGIKLLYYSSLRIVYPYEVIESKDMLLNKIMKETNETLNDRF